MSLVLYEHSTSVCVQKVRLTLAEKGVDYEGRYVDLHSGGQFDPAYLAINPGAVVPTLVHDGHVLRESSVIQHYIDDFFPDPPLMPADPLARYRVRWFMKTIDDPVHAACGAATFGIAFRKSFRDAAAIEARVAKSPDPRRRARQRSVLADGFASPYVADAVRDFDALLAGMERALADAPFLGGAAYSLADAAATPYVNRLFVLGVLAAWASRCPAVMDWFDRVRARPSYATAIARHFTDADADRMRPAEDDAAARVAALLDAA